MLQPVRRGSPGGFSPSHKGKSVFGNKSVNLREKEAQVVKSDDKKISQKPINGYKALKLPNILRSITDVYHSFIFFLKAGFSVKKSIVIVYVVIIFGLSFWQTVLLVQKGLALQSLLAQREKISQELSLWENITQKYPTYRDAYFQAAILAYRLGDISKEQTLLSRTLQLDPNFQPGQDLEKISR